VAELSGLNASQPDLDRMAKECEQTGQSLAQGMADLISRIEALQGTGMKGATYNALVSVSGDLDDGLRKILQALNELAGKMSDAALKYGSHDTDAAQEIRSIAAGSGNSDVVSLLRG
jgi:WXG100 family type VII secretion target